MTEKTTTVRVGAEKYQLTPELEDLIERKLFSSLRREACCNIYLYDWEYIPAYIDEEGNEFSEAWQRVAKGTECPTALEWKEKAEHWKKDALMFSDRLRELAPVRANSPEEGSPSPCQCSVRV